MTDSSEFRVQGRKNHNSFTLNAERSTLNQICLSVFGAFLLIFSFPPFNAFPLIWIALVPWLIILPRLSFRNALLSSLIFGFAFFGGLLYWVGIFGYLPWALLSLYQALFIAAAGVCIWFCRGLSRGWRILGAAAFWTLFEWLRGLGPYGFTWGWLGYSQSSWLDFIQLASFAGVPGLTFLIVLHNAELAEAISSSARSLLQRIAPLIAVWTLIAVVVIGGHLVIKRSGNNQQELKIAIIQPTVREPGRDDANHIWTQAEVSEDRAALMKLAGQVAKEKPIIIIAPESALPGFLNRDVFLYTGATQAARKSHAWLLVGAHYEDDAARTYNSAYLFSPQGEMKDRYDKVQLVPFGEFVPGRSWLPGIKNYPIREQDLSAGAGYHTMQAGPISLGVAICFESIFPHIARKLVNQGAEILVIITNDGWFLKTAAAEQHRQMAVFRAVETRRWIARAALTGISCIIAPNGKIMDELGLYKQGALVGNVGIGEGKTFYLRFGDWFIGVVVLLAFAGFIQLLWRRIAPRTE